MSQETETPAVDASATVAVPDPMLELQRREKALRIRENKLKAELESERNKWQSELKSAPLAKLQELGITTDQLADYFLGKDAPNPEDLTKRELAEIKQQLAEQKAKEEKKLVAEFKQGVIAHVEKDTDKYELINHHRDGKKLYWDSVVAYYEEYGEVPNYSEVADKVEAELLEHGKKLMKLKKLSAADKIEGIAEAIAAEVKDEEKDTPKKKKASPSTISKSLTASSAPSNKTTVQSNASVTNHTSELAALLASKRAKWA